MSRRNTQEENSDDKNGDEDGDTAAEITVDENTGKENDSLKENGDEHSCEESESANGESDREAKEDQPGTKNPQKPGSRTKKRQRASQQNDEEGTRSHQRDKDGKEASRLMTGLINSCKSAVIPLIIFLLVIIVAILLQLLIDPPQPPDSKPPDFNFAKIFANKIVELQSSFTNQTDRFWRILKNRGLAHLKNASPSQPLVLLLAAPPAAHSMVDCFAKKLAEGLDPKYKRMLAKIDGGEERSYTGEETKKKMDDLLIRSFEKGHRAALVHHLELLPPPSPLLFYSYCDDQNAPHKHVAIIFTVHLPVEPDTSLEPKEAEGTVEKYLADIVWAKEDKDAVAALLSRVADTVALMNGEPSSSATC